MLLRVFLLLIVVGEGVLEGDLGILDLLLGGLLTSSLEQLDDLSLFLLLLPGLWSAEAFLAPGDGGCLLAAVLSLVEGIGSSQGFLLGSHRRSL